MNYLRSGLDKLRDQYAPLNHSSTFRSTGQITPEEFLQAGDFLVYKFPSWSWADASSPAQSVSYFPPGKQYLVTRGVPCRRRLDDNFAGDVADMMVGDGEGFSGTGTDGADDGWLNTGGAGNGAMSKSVEERMGDVRTVDEAGEVGEREEEEEIPDMEDEEDDEEAIIRDPKSGSGGDGYVMLL